MQPKINRFSCLQRNIYDNNWNIESGEITILKTSRSKQFMNLEIAIDKLSQIDRTTTIGVKRSADSFSK